MPDSLGSAQWESQSVVSRKYPFGQGKFWLGRAEDETAIGRGREDDRHVCLVSGSRGGKGTSIIVNNLCLWPGSAVVVDPKGENANVTVARRGRGSEHCVGMGQVVHVLDPFKAARIDESYRSCFNPLDALDPQSEEAIDEAGRLASAIVVVRDESADPFWDESARAMLRGLILHVLTAPEFEQEERNLITVRNLISRGEWRVADIIRESGRDPNGSPHELLWQAMQCNPAFDGIVAGIGTRFLSMSKEASKTFEGVLQSTSLNTEFLDSPGMRRMLVKSDFKLSELKTRPEGMTLYLSLPQRHMETHYRWLRMMVALTTSEMEIVPGRPASGHQVLMVLDEFASLRRMTAIENAVAQIAGFGMKLFFVLQSLEQLKHVYKDNWETFLSNAGVKIFFSIEDHFTREYVSKLAGETEIIRELQSVNESQAENRSYAEGRTQSESFSQSTTRGVSQSDTRGTSQSHTQGTSRSTNQSQTEGINQSRNFSESFGTNQSMGWSRGSSSGSSFGGSGGPTFSSGGNSSSSGSSGSSHGTSHGTSEGTSSSVSRGVTDGTSQSDTRGHSKSQTTGTSYSDTEGRSDTSGSSQTHTQGSSRTAGTGRSESVHRRPLIQPDEVGRFFTRIDERTDSAYPGFALVMVTGADPMVVRRTHYFEDPQFIDCFSPHPDHQFTPALPNPVQGIRRFIDALEGCMDYATGSDGSVILNGKRRLAISQWLIESGSLVTPGQVAFRIDGVPPDNRTVQIRVPYFGKMANIAANGHALTTGESSIPDGDLFAVKSYSNQRLGVDPFAELRKACSDVLGKLKPPTLVAKQSTVREPAKQRVSDIPLVYYSKGAVIGFVVGLVVMVGGISLKEGHFVAPFDNWLRASFFIVFASFFALLGAQLASVDK